MVFDGEKAPGPRSISRVILDDLGDCLCRNSGGLEIIENESAGPCGTAGFWEIPSSDGRLNLDC